MTNEEKSQIAKMRRDGIGYKKIAQILGFAFGQGPLFLFLARSKLLFISSGK